MRHGGFDGGGPQEENMVVWWRWQTYAFLIK